MTILRQHLRVLAARTGPESKTSSKARIMPVHLVAEQFACNECGFWGATQAALKAHNFKMHYEEDDKKARQQEIIQHKKSQATEHARNGVPTCRHCGHDFETWPAFTYSRNCPEIRHVFSQQDCQSQLAELQGALTFQDEVLQAATHMTWQEMALLPVVKRSHNRCVECNHWSASPLYVRRHLRAKRPELMLIVNQTISRIIQSDFALSDPCRFCGQAFRLRRDHLRSCIGIFNGHYLLRRLARKSDKGREHVIGSESGAFGGHQRAGHDQIIDSRSGHNGADNSGPGLGANGHVREEGGRQGGSTVRQNDSSKAGRGREGRPAVKMAPRRKQRQPEPGQRKILGFFKLGRLAKLGEGRQQLQAGHGQAEATGRHANNVSSQAGAPAHDQPSGHELHHLYPDGHHSESGSNHLRGRPEVEAGQGHEPGFLETPSQGHPVPAPPDIDDFGPGEPSQTRQSWKTPRSRMATLWG